MKNATTAPNFRLWTPTGEPFPAVGASAVGFGKAMTDVDTKWFNKDAWRVESFLKRDKNSAAWVDPSASKNSKGGSVSATFGYDDVDRKLKYRGKTDDSLKHESELSYTLPLLDGEQRVKVQVASALDKQTFLPNTQDATYRIFWKAILPALTAEAVVKQTPKGTDSLTAWVQGEVSDDIAYGGLAQYSVADAKLKLWEFGLLNTLPFGEGVVASRLVTRNGDDFELGVLPPQRSILGKKAQVYVKTNHNLSTQNTDVAVTTEVKACPNFDLKLRCAFKGLKDLSTAFAAIWSAPGGWRVAASVTDPASDKMQFGLRFAQGSTPPPL